jgi:hypothetical protein
MPRILTDGGMGYYRQDELEDLGCADICDDNDCVFGCIYEDGEIELYPSSQED